VARLLILFLVLQKQAVLGVALSGSWFLAVERGYKVSN
jgi:hypothetical protein